jgi:hypothetical protein
MAEEDKQGLSGCAKALIVFLLVIVVAFGLLVGMCGGFR